MKTGIIILAAGGSSRMRGEPKQLLEFEGQTLVRRAAKAALASGCGPVVLVLGAGAEALLAEINDLPVMVAVNKEWKRGMGSSIKAGLARLIAEAADVEGVILGLADQPLVTSLHFARLVEAYRQDKPSIVAIVASEYENTAGVPAFFAREMFADLRRIPDDKGAKSLIMANENVKKVPVPEASIDIDSRQDYERLIKSPHTSRHPA